MKKNHSYLTQKMDGTIFRKLFERIIELEIKIKKILCVRH